MKWIDVNEALPRRNEVVRVRLKDGTETTGRYDAGRLFVIDRGPDGTLVRATHWARLPK